MYLETQPDTKTHHLSPESEAVVKATLPLVGSKINEIAPVFYGKMFAAHPELISDTFNRGNQRSGDQQKALAASVATFATMLVDPAAPDPVEMLNRIAHKHVSLGIVEDQYPIVYENLMAAIAEVLGEDVVTQEVADAWFEVYWLMAKVLIRHETDLYHSDGVEPGDVFRPAVVAAKEQLTDDVWAYTLTGEFTEPKPGQYTSVGVKLPDGARQLRQYSIIGGDAGTYRIAVQDDGEVSTFLRDRVAVGSVIEATIAAGDLVLDESTDAPVVLISRGIGSTPMVGILSHLAQKQSQRRVLVLHVDESEERHAQRAETVALVVQLADAELRTFYGEHLDVDTQVPDGADVYLCGGTSFLQSLRGALDGRSLHAVHYELFSPNDWLLR